MPFGQSQRLRFLSAEPEEIAQGSVRTTVKLWGRDGHTIVGVAASTANRSGETAKCRARNGRCGLPGSWHTQVGHGVLGGEIGEGVQCIVVIIALAVPLRDGGRRRIVGAYVADDDVVRGAAIAVLNATNRYLVINVFSA